MFHDELVLMPSNLIYSTDFELTYPWGIQSAVTIYKFNLRPGGGGVILAPPPVVFRG